MDAQHNIGQGLDQMILAGDVGPLVGQDVFRPGYMAGKVDPGPEKAQHHRLRNHVTPVYAAFAHGEAQPAL